MKIKKENIPDFIVGLAFGTVVAIVLSLIIWG